jgi:protein-disulfide isomerase
MDLARWRQSALLAAILLLSTVGAWVSTGLLELHDGASPTSAAAGRLIARLCSSSPDEAGACVATAQSPWAEIEIPIPWHPLEVPTAFVALAYFIALGVWYAFVGEAQPAWRPLGWLPIALAVIGIYASIFFISLMVMGRAPWCGGCVAVHAINLLLVISIGLSRWRFGKPSPTAAALNCRQGAAVIAFAVVLIIVLYTARSRRLILQNRVAWLLPSQRMVESVQQNAKLLMDAYLSEPKHDIALRPDEINPAATHTLVVFLDFECLPCMIAEQTIHGEISSDFGNGLNVVVRHYPLCKACNPKIPRTVHPSACPAAFERMSDLLFEYQSDLDNAINRDLAVKADIDPNQFLKLLQDPAVRKRVADDVAEAHALGVNSTPTIFLDGRRVPPICETSEFWKAVSSQ